MQAIEAKLNCKTSNTNQIAFICLSHTRRARATPSLTVPQLFEIYGLFQDLAQHQGDSSDWLTPSGGWVVGRLAKCQGCCTTHSFSGLLGSFFFSSFEMAINIAFVSNARPVANLIPVCSNCSVLTAATATATAKVTATATATKTHLATCLCSSLCTTNQPHLTQLDAGFI